MSNWVITRTRVRGQAPPGRALRFSLPVGVERIFHQDLAFGLRQLSDIALRALSSAVNDPTTTVQALDRVRGRNSVNDRAAPARPAQRYGRLSGMAAALPREVAHGKNRRRVLPGVASGDACAGPPGCRS
ncbi:hypothetical protein GCM10022384_70650 [Streptomyces marokkonensis]|uniref:Uncharacterized protein n=1 Tax=Streptomyces marokkonensis TaxID=324855 RepID=A0ABP7SZY9_9ACTN